MLKNQLVAELFQERFWKLPRGLMFGFGRGELGRVLAWLGATQLSSPLLCRGPTLQ